MALGSSSRKGLLLILGNLGVSLVKKFIFFWKILDFYGSVDCFVVKSKFKGNLEAWFPQAVTHDGSEGCSRCTLDRYLIKNIF